MQRKQLKFKGRKIGEVFTFFDYDPKVKDQNKFISNIVKQIKPVMGYGYAGFSDRKFLQENLRKNIFDAGDSHTHSINIAQSKVLRVIDTSITKAQQKLFVNLLDIYVVPSFNSFIGEQMGGTSGTTPWKNRLILFINSVRGWERYLAATIIHEYNHAVALQYHRWSTLLNKIVLEGWAEVFLEEVLPVAPLFVGKIISQSDARKYFKQARRHMSSTDNKVYDEVFYRNEKYPLWAGYGMGYWIVKSFRKKYPEMSWQQMVRLNSRQILKQSGFDK